MATFRELKKEHLLEMIDEVRDTYVALAINNYITEVKVDKNWLYNEVDHNLPNEIIKNIEVKKNGKMNLFIRNI